MVNNAISLIQTFQVDKAYAESKLEAAKPALQEAEDALQVQLLTLFFTGVVVFVVCLFVCCFFLGGGFSKSPHSFVTN